MDWGKTSKIPTGGTGLERTVGARFTHTCLCTWGPGARPWAHFLDLSTGGLPGDTQSLLAEDRSYPQQERLLKTRVAP